MSCKVCNGECESVEVCEEHVCTGDNCYCIGGDENLDAARLADAWDAYCLARVAPFDGE